MYSIRLKSDVGHGDPSVGDFFKKSVKTLEQEVYITG